MSRNINKICISVLNKDKEIPFIFCPNSAGLWLCELASGLLLFEDQAPSHSSSTDIWISSILARLHGLKKDWGLWLQRNNFHHSDLEVRGRDACQTLPECPLLPTSFCILLPSSVPSSLVFTLFPLLFSCSPSQRAAACEGQCCIVSFCGFSSVFINHWIAGSLNMCGETMITKGFF